MTVLQASGANVGTNASTANFNFTSVTAGSTIIVHLMAWRSGGVSAATSVSDGDGTYVRDIFVPNNNSAYGVWRRTNASAGTHTITVTTSSGSYFTYAAIEVDSDLGVQVWRGGTGTSTAVTTGATVLAALAPSFVVGGCAIEANQASITVAVTDPVWTQQVEQLNFSAQNAGELNYKLVTDLTTYTASWTAASSGVFASGIVVYHEFGGGGSPPAPYASAYFG